MRRTPTQGLVLAEVFWAELDSYHGAIFPAEGDPGMGQTIPEHGEM